MAEPDREKLLRLLRAICSAVIEADLCDRPEDWNRAVNLAFEIEGELDYDVARSLNTPSPAESNKS